MSDITFDEVKLWLISHADREQLRALSDLISYRNKSLGIQAGLTFKPGDLVCFDAKRRGVIKGKFVRLMHKNAEVLADNGMTWKVAPILLKRQEVSSTSV